MRDAFNHPQTAIVLGGTSEIAGAILDRLIASRLRAVVLVGRDAAALEVAAASLRNRGVTASVIVADATDPTSAEPAIAAAFAALGEPCDLLLVALAILGDQAASDDDAALTATTFTVNATWPAAALAASRGRLVAQGSGRVLVLSTVAAIRTRRTNYAYGASKQALDGFARGFAASVAGHGIGVTIVRPGFVTTKMTAHLSPAPMSTTAGAVADVAVAALAKGSAVAYAPPALKVVFAVLRHLPEALWRKVPG